MAITPRSKGLGNIGAIVDRQGRATTTSKAPVKAVAPKMAPKPAARVAPKPAPKMAPNPFNKKPDTRAPGGGGMDYNGNPIGGGMGAQMNIAKPGQGNLARNTGPGNGGPQLVGGPAGRPIFGGPPTNMGTGPGTPYDPNNPQDTYNYTLGFGVPTDPNDYSMKNQLMKELQDQGYDVSNPLTSMNSMFQGRLTPDQYRKLSQDSRFSFVERPPEDIGLYPSPAGGGYGGYSPETDPNSPLYMFGQPPEDTGPPPMDPGFNYDNGFTAGGNQMYGYGDTGQQMALMGQQGLGQMFGGNDINGMFPGLGGGGFNGYPSTMEYMGPDVAYGEPAPYNSNIESPRRVINQVGKPGFQPRPNMSNAFSPDSNNFGGGGFMGGGTGSMFGGGGFAGK